MYDYYDEEPYYEPTPADEIFFDAKQKLEDCLKESIKNKIKNLENENAELKAENMEMRNKISQVKIKEKQLEQEEKDLEYKILRRKFSEMLKPLENQYTIYVADYEYKWLKKCDKCDEDRKIYFTSPLGRKMAESCECSKNFKVWEVKPIQIKRLSLYKNKDKYPYVISVTPKYESPSYEDVYCKFELKTFVENLKEFKKNLIETGTNWSFEDFRYDNVGFQLSEDCQEYCDYLNGELKKNVPEEYLKEIYG